MITADTESKLCYQLQRDATRKQTHVSERVVMMLGGLESLYQQYILLTINTQDCSAFSL